MNDEEKLIELLDNISRSTANQVVETSNKKNLKYQPATVVGYDESTYKATVYFGNNPDELFTFYNKSGCKLYEGDNVKIQYTLNPAKGDLVVRCGRTDPINVGGSECEHQKFLSFSANEDGTYTYNDVNYNFEVDEETGYITKIQDSKNNQYTFNIDNVDVNKNILDYNTMIMSMAMVAGLYQSHGTLWLFNKKGLNSDYIVDNFKGFDDCKFVNWTGDLRTLDTSALTAGYVVKTKQSRGNYWIYNTEKQIFEKPDGYRDDCGSTMIIPIKPIRSLKSLSTNSTIVSGVSNHIYCLVEIFLLHYDETTGKIDKLVKVTHRSTNVENFPHSLTLTNEVDASEIYNAIALQSCVGETNVDKVWVNY